VNQARKVCGSTAGAIAAALGPLVGGVFTTYASWRCVFAGEVVIVLVILVLTRRMKDRPAEQGTRLNTWRRRSGSRRLAR
jgi:MFS family permease